jgi:hypothetical protein
MWNRKRFNTMYAIIADNTLEVIKVHYFHNFVWHHDQRAVYLVVVKEFGLGFKHADFYKGARNPLFRVLVEEEKRSAFEITSFRKLKSIQEFFV